MNQHGIMMNLVAGLSQFIVAAYALRLNRIFGPARVGWSLFAAFALLALLHLVQSTTVLNAGDAPAIKIEGMYAMVSILLLIGMAHIETIFKEHLRLEQEEKRLRANLETEVEKKTIYLTRTIEALEAEIQARKLIAAELSAHVQLLESTRRRTVPAAETREAEFAGLHF